MTAERVGRAQHEHAVAAPLRDHPGRAEQIKGDAQRRSPGS
jgi:hypothetical protein